MDRDKQREQKRAAIECGIENTTPIPPAICPPETSFRRLKDCDVPDTCIPDVLAAPSANPIFTQRPRANPEPLTIPNAEPALTCDDLPDSPPLTDGLPDFSTIDTSDTFDWNDVPDITDEQLDYISIQGSSALSGVVGGTALEIRALTRLTLVQSLWVRAEIDRIQLSVDEQAVNLGLALLDCFWENVEQVANCPAGALTAGGTPTASNPSTVVAGTYRSTNSQADADALAEAEAIANLVCVWGNAEKTINCEVDLSKAGLSDIFVTIPANTLFSLISQEDADDQALSLALTQIECVYQSVALSDSCTYAGDEWDLLGEANVVNRVPGSSVTIPAGEFTSLIDQADANAQAQALLDLLLLCRYGHPAIAISCADPISVATGEYSYLFGDEEFVDLDLNVGLSVDLGLAESTIVSDISPADALEKAEALAAAQTICTYCNPEILPLCDTPVDLIYSYDKTLGIEAGIFCSVDPAIVIPQAAQVAIIPEVTTLQAGYECRWGNQANTFTCVSADIKPDGYAISELGVVTGLGHPTKLTSDSLEASVTVPANLFFSTSQAAANELAVAFAQASLNCMYSSRVELECVAYPDTRIYDYDGEIIPAIDKPAIWLVRDADGELADPLVVTLENPIVIVEYEEMPNPDPGTAVELAFSLAAQQLQPRCLHTNHKRDMVCPDGSEIRSVNAGTFEATTTEAANMMAEVAAKADLANCENDPFEFECNGKPALTLVIGADGEPKICKEGAQLIVFGAGGGGGGLCLPCLDGEDFGKTIKIELDELPLRLPLGQTHYWLKVTCVDGNPAFEYLVGAHVIEQQEGCIDLGGDEYAFQYYLGYYE